jgi:glycosyltransferase involved in cell wall biosynthesis
MKIGIIGTRGIPNRYGGFEQFTENFALYLKERGHEVTVYNSSLHPYSQDDYKGVKIIHCFDPENKIGTAGQFVYDFCCIIDSRKRKFDIILQLGYTSSSIFSFLFPRSAKIVTNMDGLEWKRDKYSPKVQKFLHQAERWAVKYSDHLIADSSEIHDYLMKTYHHESTHIPYGANIFKEPDESALSPYSLVKDSYNILVARLEPENNIETIIQAHLQSGSNVPLLIVGNYNTHHGHYLHKKYQSGKIKFLGAIYDQPVLNNLRYFSSIYFHGHSVGGTNPSLIEAMASNAFIIAHNNVFNRNILGNDAYYFDNTDSLVHLMEQGYKKGDHKHFMENNTIKIRDTYSLESIHQQVESLFNRCLQNGK